MHDKEKIKRILNALQQGTAQVRKTPTEAAYLRAEAELQRAAASKTHWRNPSVIIILGLVGFSIALALKFWKKEVALVHATPSLSPSLGKTPIHESKKATQFPSSAQLTGKIPNSQIDVYSAPSIDSESPHYGLVGDRVSILKQTIDSDKDIWYFVEFPSRATGWIREDSVQVK